MEYSFWLCFVDESKKLEWGGVLVFELLNVCYRRPTYAGACRGGGPRRHVAQGAALTAGERTGGAQWGGRSPPWEAETKARLVYYYKRTNLILILIKIQPDLV